MKQPRKALQTALLATAVVVSNVAFASYASAQCVGCVETNRDPFTEGLATHPSTGEGERPGYHGANAQMRPQRSPHRTHVAHHRS